MAATQREVILGNVVVGGEIYQLASVGCESWYEAIRLADHRIVGTIVASGWMWRFCSETPDLMQDIVQAAMEDGLVQAPPPD